MKFDMAEYERYHADSKRRAKIRLKILKREWYLRDMGVFRYLRRFDCSTIADNEFGRWAIDWF